MHVVGFQPDPLPMTRIHLQDSNKVIWIAAVTLNPHSFPLKYKYLIKSNKNMGTLIEPNERILRIDDESVRAVHIRDDGSFRVKYYP